MADTILKTIAKELAAPRIDPIQAIGNWIVVQYPTKGPTAEELSKIEDFHNSWKSCYDSIVQNTQATADRGYSNQLSLHGELAAVGKLGEMRARSLEDWRGEARAKEAAARQQAAIIEHESGEFALPIVLRFMEAVEQATGERESSEIKEAQNFGLTFAPSPKLVAMRRLISTLKLRTAQRKLYGNPKEHFFFLNLK